MTKHEKNRDPDPDNPITPAASARATISLEALAVALNAVDTASVAGRSGLPMLSFKREGDGTWMHGQRKTVVEDGTRWAVNPTTFRRGYICFSAAGKVLGERLAPVNLPMPDPSELPDKGAPWVEEWGVNLRCLDGADAGLEVTYKTTTVGGVQAIAGLIDEVRNRLNGKMHGGKISPLVHLNKYDYTNSYGKIWNPLLDVITWMSMDGPAPAARPSPSPQPAAAAAEQPRRRRVG